MEAPFMIWWWLAVMWWQFPKGGSSTVEGWGDGPDTGYTLPPSVILNDGSTFDYVVVGAGAGGAAAAARLALAGRSVLLVEAGPDPGRISTIPGAADALLGSYLDWQYDTISNNASCLSYRNRQCRFSRGRCLGGSTSINYMMYVRGNRRDYDDFAVPGWTWLDLEPYFFRYEGLQDLSRLPPSSAPYHNTTGTMRLEFFTDPQNPWHRRLVEGYTSLNIPFNADVSAASQIGVTRVIGYVYDNERMSSARAYLARPDVKKRLKVAKLTRCTAVIIDDDNVARGVEVTHGIFRTKMRIFARKEVILSAGAIATPQILMLSGIGPKDHLRLFNITVRVDLPVGDDTSDHIFPLVFVKVGQDAGILQKVVDAGRTVVDIAEYLALKSGPLASNGLTDISTFLNTKCYDFNTRQLANDRPQCELPSVQYIHAYIERGLAAAAPSLFQRGTDLDDAVTEQLKEISSENALLVISPLILKPYSRGTVRLASADPSAPPAIFPNFLSDERDLEEMVRSVLILEDLMQTSAFASGNASIVYLKLEGCPAVEADRREYWACYSRHMSHSTYHAAGGAALGPALEAALRVRGVRGLRVADLAALPGLPRGNTAAVAIAIGERVADLILNGS